MAVKESSKTLRVFTMVQPLWPVEGSTMAAHPPAFAPWETHRPTWG